jgi:2-C-methyl-D-erythritol 4-phosphate cytidylyltransferase
MFVTAIIAAGGRGLRFGGGPPKQLLEIGGRAILERSVAAFLAHPAVNEVVVALPQPLSDDPPRICARRKPLRIVSGGRGGRIPSRTRSAPLMRPATSS